MIDPARDGALGAIVARARAWTFDEALPFWADVGRDGADRGFVERLDRNGRPDSVNFKRMRVQARQIYVFSHAHLLGWRGGLAAAEAGYRFILAHGQVEGGGWARVLGRGGGVLDPAFDLYDQSFVLFAFAWLHRAGGDPEPLRLAEETMAAIDRRLRRSDGRGYRSADPDGAPGGLQNPHMHLLEAMLALHDASGDSRWLARAADLGRLFADVLFDANTGTLAETFDDDWRRLQPVVVEPGHHFEWIWLLDRLCAATGQDFGVIAERLFHFADTHGVDRSTGLACDEISNTGTVVQSSRRLWPQTERLKALLARADSGVACDTVGITATGVNIFERYIAPAPRGCWRDRLDSEARTVDEPIPASTLYHLFLAFSELMRLQPMLEVAT